VIGAAVSGTYTGAGTTSVEPTPVGDSPPCDGTVAASYGERTVEVACRDYEAVVTDGLSVSPVLAAGYETGAFAQAVGRLLLTRVRTTARGFCDLCGGRTDTSLTRDDEGGIVRSEMGHLGVTDRCRACGRRNHLVVGAVVLDHPAVVGFLYDHGIDARETPSGGRLAVRATRDRHGNGPAPDRGRGRRRERLVLELDADLDVVEHDGSSPARD